MRRRWDTAHANLRLLYEQRAPGVTQKEFAKRIGIAQSMLAMILSGDRPLPLDLAPAFAKELGCTIYDICPEMADYIKTELVPLLGKALRRAAAVLLVAGATVLSTTLVSPSSAYAAAHPNCVLCKIRSLARKMVRFLTSLCPIGQRQQYSVFCQ